MNEKPSQEKVNTVNQNDVTIELKLDKLANSYSQQWESGEYSGWEVDEEFVSLSKEVASYYEPLVDKLVQAGILTVNIAQTCAVFEVDSVVPERKSYFNEGKIVLMAAEDQVNGNRGELKAKFTKRLGKFLNI